MSRLFAQLPNEYRFDTIIKTKEIKTEFFKKHLKQIVNEQWVYFNGKPTVPNESFGLIDSLKHSSWYIVQFDSCCSEEEGVKTKQYFLAYVKNETVSLYAIFEEEEKLSTTVRFAEQEDIDNDGNLEIFIDCSFYSSYDGDITFGRNSFDSREIWNMTSMKKLPLGTLNYSGSGWSACSGRSWSSSSETKFHFSKEALSLSVIYTDNSYHGDILNNGNGTKIATYFYTPRGYVLKK